MANANPTMRDLRARAAAEGVEQIKDWSDPRLVDLIAGLHKYAEGQNWCAQFDDLALKQGIPARPKQTYFKITRTGSVPFGGTTYPVTAEIEVYGEDGDEVGAIQQYQQRYDVPFETALKKALQKAALAAIQEGLTVELDEPVPAAEAKAEKK